MKQIALLLTLLCANALNGMQKEKPATDAQIYQLFSHASKENPEYYLPNDLIPAIMTTARKITEERYWSTYGTCVDDFDSLLHFIETRAQSNEDIQTTVDILKICLQCSGKSLSTIRQDFYERTILHDIVDQAPDNSITYTDYCIDVLCQTAKASGDFLSLLYAKGDGDNERTTLHYAVWRTNKYIVEKLITVSDDKILDLIYTGDGNGSTPLDYLKMFLSPHSPNSDEYKKIQAIIKLLESKNT